MRPSKEIGSRLSRVSAVLGVVAATAAIGAAWTAAHSALEPSASSVFSVRAVTGSVEVRPLCADILIWDLPQGEILPATCETELEPGDDTDALKEKCGLQEGEVTVTMLAGAAARIETKPDLEVAFAIEPLAACDVSPRDAVRISVGYDTLKHDAGGYFYRAKPTSARNNRGSPATAGDPTISASEEEAADLRAATPADLAYLALPLKGRVIVGEEMQFGGGWTAEPSTVLSSATFSARAGTPWSDVATILTEEVEPGTIIDTHSRWFSEVVKDSRAPDPATAIPSANGFVQVQPGSLGVQIYQPLALGLRRYDLTTPRIVTVSRWRAALASPQFQVFASVCVACVSVLGLVFGYFQALEPMRNFLLGSPASDDRPGATADRAAARSDRPAAPDDRPAAADDRPAASRTASTESAPPRTPSTPPEPKKP